MSTSTLTYASAVDSSTFRNTGVDERYNFGFRFAGGGKTHGRWQTPHGTLQGVGDDSGGAGCAKAFAADLAAVNRPKNVSQRDALTGLFNRYWFQEQLEQWVARKCGSDRPASLIYLDLDDFKCINDTYGHEFGDVLLTTVAMEMSFHLQDKEILARLGGDEFALLVADAGKQEAEAIAAQVLTNMAQICVNCNGVPLRLTASAGVATFPGDAESCEELLASAKIAMYEAKSAGKNTWRAYQPDNNNAKDAVQRRFWDERLQHALDHGLLRTHLQGIYDVSTRCLSHMEVLLRMQDADDPASLVMPNMFIPPAEKSGKILAVDRWVIGESVRLLSRSPELPPLAVNISCRSFEDPTLPEYITGLLQEYRVPSSRLYLEVTETAAIGDMRRAQHIIAKLRAIGCCICLDDFGAGFSSFSYLKHLKVDVIKIDGGFVRDLLHDHDSRALVQSMVSMARSMSKRVVAECVENEETLEILGDLGVDLAQGYLLDRPRAAQAWLDALSCRPGLVAP